MNNSYARFGGQKRHWEEEGQRYYEMQGKQDGQYADKANKPRQHKD